MRIAIVLDPLEQIKTYKDSTYAMMVAAHARGHEIHVCEQGELSLVGGQALAVIRRLHLTDISGKLHDWYRLDPALEAPLSAFDAVLNRKDPPFDMEYIYSTYLLEHAQRSGARVFNDPRAVRDHNEKFSIAQFSEFTAPTIVTRDPARLRAFAHEHGEAVFKLLDGMGGASIFRARADDPNLSVIIETLNLFGARSVMAQRYLPRISEGDKRVLLIGGNLAAGGTGVARPLAPEDLRIGEALAPVLQARGLLLVGLDVIGDCLTEVNVTSPTCFQEITQQTGFDVAGMFIDALERAVGG